MSAEEWERIKQLFDAALNLGAADREAYLEKACAGNPQLRATIDELLQNHSSASGFLEDVSRSRIEKPVFSDRQLIAGRFRVLRMIASGGMGEVYEVYDERLQLRVALKTIRPHLVANREAYERFKHEVWVAREVPHAGICRMFELVEHVDPENPGTVVPCITMKLLEGINLQTELQRRRPMPLQEALPLIKQIAEALDVLHDHGIVHRDLKPSNIMLVNGGNRGRRVVLTDFGLAKHLDHATLAFETASHTRPGAPYFLAPELLSQGGRESVESDIYALGLVIDEMVTTSRAFTADSIHGLFAQKLWEKPIPPSARAVSLPPRLEHVILRCLDSDPGRRYSRALDVVQDLEGEFAMAVAPRSSPRVPVGPVQPDQTVTIATQLPPGPALTRRKLIYLASVPATAAVAAFAVGQPWRPLHTSLLVFPVANLTGSKDNDALCKGTTLELIRRLSQVQGIDVYPVREFRNQTDPEPLKRSRFWLEGHLRHYGGRVRMTVELIESDGGKLVWSENFERQLVDPLRLESEIAEGTVRTLESHLLNAATPSLMRAFSGPIRRVFAAGPPQLPKPATSSTAAFQHYIRGLSLLDERDLKHALEAANQFELAIKRDPNFALAYAALCDVQRVLMDLSYAPEKELAAKALGYAEQAVAMDPALPDVHASLAAVLQIFWEWERSEQEYRLAISLHPRFSRAKRWYAGLLLQRGQFDEALRELREALELDPFDYPAQYVHGFFLFYSGTPHEAARQLESVLERKNLLPAQSLLGQVYAALSARGTSAEQASYAAKAFRQAEIVKERELQNRTTPNTEAPLKFSDLIYGLTYAYQKKPEAAMEYVRRLEKGRSTGNISAATVARIYAVLGKHELAMDLLEIAADNHDREITNVKIAPFYASLHGHPRFQALLRRMRLPVS